MVSKIQKEVGRVLAVEIREIELAREMYRKACFCVRLRH
jgi:hypothetical protein